MFMLTKEQIDLIASDIKGQGIAYSHLEDDLIDHVCCDVEQEMDNGSDFNEAYRTVKERIGTHRLKQIQKDTLYFVDIKYRIMKDSIKITGVISMIMLAFAAIFKIMHWPGAGGLLVLGFFILCFVFLPVAIYAVYKQNNKKYTLIYIAALAGGISGMIGILFKIQHYPYANLLILIAVIIICVFVLPGFFIIKYREGKKSTPLILYIMGLFGLTSAIVGANILKLMHLPGATVLIILGMVILISIILPWYAYRSFKDTKSVSARFIYLLIGGMYFVLFSALLAINKPFDAYKIYCESDNIIETTTAIIASENEVLYNYFNSDTSANARENAERTDEINDHSDDIFAYIDNIKVRLIMFSGEMTVEEAKACVKNIYLIDDTDFFTLANFPMIGENNDGMAYELKKTISEYRDYLLNVTGSDEKSRKLIKKILDTSNPDDPVYTWETYNFYDCPLLSAINTLTAFQRNIRIAESEALYSIYKSKHDNTLSGGNIINN